MALNKPTDEKTAPKSGEAEAKPESKPESKAVTHKESTDLVDRNTEIAAANAGITSFMDSALEEGFEGLEIGRGSFVSVVLDTASFVDSNEETDLELDGVDMSKHFRFIPLNSKSKFIHRFLQPGGEAKDAEIFITYGNSTTTHTNEDIEQIKALREEDGVDYQGASQYLELLAMVIPQEATDDSEVCTLALLSVPPASRAKFSGAIGTYNARNRANPISSVTTAIVDAKIGTKRKNKNGDSYMPWAFQAVGKLK